MPRIAALWLVAAMSLPLSGQTPGKTHAQELVDETVAKHPDVLVLAMHVTPPKSADNVIIASNIGRIGKKADEDDLRVIQTGKPNLEVNKTGDRFEVELVLQDVSGKTIGALGVVFPYKAGDNKSEFQRRAERIRDDLRKRIPTLASLFEPLAGSVAVSAASLGYKVVGKYSVSGDGRWDYITFDVATKRLFVAHGNKVDVLDATTGTPLGEIPNTPGVHGVVVPPGINKGYISCGTADVVKVFDRATLKTIGEIKTGKNPDAIIYDAVSKRVLVSNGDSDSVSVIDTATDKVLGTIAVGGKPEYAVSDEKALVYLNLEDKNETVALDIKTLTVKKRVAVPGCDEPASLAMDVKTRRLFAGCGNKAMVAIDADAGKVVKVLPVGEHTDATVFDPDTHLIFNSNGDGTITVIREDGPDQYTVVDTIKTQRGAKTMALDPATKKIYMPTAENLPDYATGPPRPKEKPFPMKPFIVLVLGK